MAKESKKPIAKKKVKPENVTPGVYAALFKFQGENISVPKRGKGMIDGRPYTYPMLDDSLTATAPFLQKHKLVVTQVGQDTDLVTILHHVPTGQEIVSKLPLGAPTSSQDLGSRITYLRRYMFNAILKLSNEDLDGAKNPQESASEANPVPMPAQPAMAPLNLPQQASPAGSVLRNEENSIPKMRSENYLRAEGAIKSAQSPEAIDQLAEQVKNSVRLNDEEKVELLALLKKEDVRMGTVHLQ